VLDVLDQQVRGFDRTVGGAGGLVGAVDDASISLALPQPAHLVCG
jgi:hypothetical protein